jgi:hypothetical protein
MNYKIYSLEHDSFLRCVADVNYITGDFNISYGDVNCAGLYSLSTDNEIILQYNIIRSLYDIEVNGGGAHVEYLEYVHDALYGVGFDNIVFVPEIVKGHYSFIDCFHLDEVL